MNYSELINAIVSEYGNDSYNVKKVLEDEIGEMEGDGSNFIIFEMYDKKFEITREVKFDESNVEDDDIPYSETFKYVTIKN